MRNIIKTYILLAVLITNSFAQFIEFENPIRWNGFIHKTEFTIIAWKSEDVESLKIEISYDNGQRWSLVANNIAADSGTHAWFPPRGGTKCKIRLSDVSDPDVFIENSIPFSIKQVHSDYIAINEVKMWFLTDGSGSHSSSNWSGLFWPGGENSENQLVYKDGLLWAGKVNGEIRCNGSMFRSGLQGGAFSDEEEDFVRFKNYKIRNPDFSLFNDSLDTRLENDWINWPMDLGAPWSDYNNDGFFTVGLDEPKLLGDETNWFVMNDMDSLISPNSFGSAPLGFEVQCTIFGYKNGRLGDVVFKKYLLINKGNNFIEDMIIGKWSDIDISSGYDDYVGCDTLLDLGYAYNSDEDDWGFDIMPAIGYMFLKTPVIDGKEIGMSAFSPNFRRLDNLQHDPAHTTIEGGIEVYNLLQGKLNNGEPFINPYTNKPDKFGLSGNPVAKTGWYEGSGWPDGPPDDDRRLMICSGPFDFAPGDSQEIVIAIVVAQGDNHLDSVTKLKEKSNDVRDFYNNEIEQELYSQKYRFPPSFSLSQNYPNPFNFSTVINYNLSVENQVKLNVYGSLGRRVKTLVNKTVQAGKHEVVFNAVNLASGVYYYKLKTSRFEKTRKMLLLR